MLEKHVPTNTTNTTNNNNSHSIVIENITVNAKGTTADEVVRELVPKLKLALSNM